MIKYIVDTHALIWFIEGNSRLGNNAQAILSDATSQLILPAIVLAEAVWIVEKGKTSIPSVNDLLSVVNDDPRIIICPLDQSIITKSINIQEINEMHDRLIVATALFLQIQGEIIALLTCDLNITESKLVTTIW